MKKSCTEYLVGIDPGLVNIGIVTYPYCLNVSDLNKYPDALGMYIFRPRTDDDIATRYRNIREFFDLFFKAVPPVMVFIEEVDLRPGIARKPQTFLFASSMIILSSLSKDIGYYQINKHQIKKILGYVTKEKKILDKKSTHKRLIKDHPFLKDFPKRVGSKYEHIFDALAVLKAGVKLLNL